MFQPNAQQIKILELLIMGFSNKSIAKARKITVATVEYHLRRMFLATQTHNRVQLAIWWLENRDRPLRQFAG